MNAPLVAVRELRIPLHGDVFRVELGIPRQASGLVYLLRDNGNVVRGNALAFALRESGFGTAICHLLTDAERERVAVYRRVPVCPALLAHRLLAVVDAVGDESELPAGIAASGIGAAAALRVAALRPLALDAIACRHAKRISMRSLRYIRAATLFLGIAGDLACIRPMTRAFQQLPGTKRFEIVPGGSPAFDDAHSFAIACDLTAAWMRKHVGRDATAVAPPLLQPTSVSSAITVIPQEIHAV